MHEVFLVKYQRLSDWIKQKLRWKSNYTVLVRNTLKTKGHETVKNKRLRKAT